jgi:uncharacterized protein YecE (DUF72 family)
MTRLLPTIAIGTSSWLFEAWKGVFYPEKLAKSRFLAYYAGQFPTVEVNTSFYAQPAANTLHSWAASVPPGFTYALKFPRIISHDKRLAGAEAETDAFLGALRTLAAAAAPAFLQFPPDFSRHSFGRPLASYLDWLAYRREGLRIAVEVRSADLMTPAFARFLADRGFALVLVEREGQPDLYEPWLQALDEAADGRPDFAFIRWIGDDKAGPEGDRELQLLRDDQLSLWAERIVALQHRGLAVFGYMHNPYEGHSPASVRRLQERLALLTALPPWPPAALPGDDEDVPPVAGPDDGDEANQLPLFE